MVKILSKSGDSLADMYDVAGSVAGIEELITHELPIVHEVGQTIFSERLSAGIRTRVTGDLLQSVQWNLFITELPNGIARILGVEVFTSNGSRVEMVSAAIQTANLEDEIPIFLWDQNEQVIDGLIVAGGAAVATRNHLINGLPTAHTSMLVGGGQPQRMDQISFRGTTLAFGAGTVKITLLVHLLFTHLGGNVPGNRGLGVPSW